MNIKPILMAWAEYNTCRKDCGAAYRLRVLGWTTESDEPVVNLGYDTGNLEMERP